MLGRGHDGKRDISNMKLWNVCFGAVYRERGRRCDFLQITDPHHKVKVKIAQLCPTLCDHVNRSTPGLPAAAKSLQSCPTLCDPIDSSPPGSSVHGIFQARGLSITNSWNSLKLMSIESVMPSNHLILCHPLFLPSVFPSIRDFSSESILHIRWPKYWNFSFSISLSKEYSGLISFRMDCLDFLAVQGLSRVFSNTTVQKHQFFSAQLSL